jgi:hypothetical protein
MKPRVRYAVVALAVCIGVVLCATVLGTMLPRRHVAATSVVLHRAAGEVWLAISDFEAQPAWRSDVRAVRHLPDRDGHPVWLQKTLNGSWPLVLTEMDPPVRLVTTVADSSQGFGGTWTYELLPLRDGTRLTITEHGFIDSPFFRCIARFVFGLHGAQEAYLRDLGRHFGEKVKPVRED